MKKLTLASAIATATMMSAGAHALTAGIASLYIDFPGPPVNYVDVTVACNNTFSGGADGVAYDLAGPVTVSGTVCIDPTFAGAPFVMLGISMTGTLTPCLMNRGAIQIATNWSTASGWTPYNVINVNPAATLPVPPGTAIPCTIPAPTTAPSGSVAAFSATLLGYPAKLYIQ